MDKKDTHARWTGKQIDIPTFGYKAHLSIDKRHRFIRKWDVTAKHDGACCGVG
ncbi:MAG: hypothetical protein HRT36_06050 [Alphaproteobacteria bacterium]|nr:hypothetical protein [Alphaproteobacteria bacterium]